MYPLKTNRRTLDKKSTDAKITFYNKGVFVARFFLQYVLNGRLIVEKTGNMSLGNKKTFNLSGKAKDIMVKG